MSGETVSANKTSEFRGIIEMYNKEVEGVVDYVDRIECNIDKFTGDSSHKIDQGKSETSTTIGILGELRHYGSELSKLRDRLARINGKLTELVG